MKNTELYVYWWAESSRRTAHAQIISSPDAGIDSVNLLVLPQWQTMIIMIIIIDYGTVLSYKIREIRQCALFHTLDVQSGNVH